MLWGPLKKISNTLIRGDLVGVEFAGLAGPSGLVVLSLLCRHEQMRGSVELITISKLGDTVSDLKLASVSASSDAEFICLSP